MRPARDDRKRGCIPCDMQNIQAKPFSVTHTRSDLRRPSLLRCAGLGLFMLSLCSLCSGCIVAGVSSSGGAFLWPGGFGLLILVAIVLWMMRRR